MTLRSYALLAVAAALVRPAAAVAQTPPDSVLTIEPVLVRVLPSTVETGSPYAVSVAAGSELTRAASGAFLEEALRAVPGVQIQNRYNLAVGERLAVRGHGARAQFGVRGIRILVDGIPATLPDGQATLDHLDLAELGRVEVLRGPSATLYGNAAGGVLHFRTLDPAEEPASVSLRAVGGAHGLRTFLGGVSGTAGTLGYRVGASHLTYDGYRTDPVAADGRTYGAAERTVVNALATFPTLGGELRIVANGVDLEAENPGSLAADAIAAGDRGAYRFNVLRRTRKDVRQGQVGVTWQGGLGRWSGEFSSWGIRRELVNPIPTVVIDLLRNAGGGRALFLRTLPVPGATLSVGAGLEGEFQWDRRFNFRNVDGDKGDLTLWQIEQVQSGGVFVQGRLDFPSGVSLQTGLRYDRIRFSADDRFVRVDDPDDSGRRVMDALSPSAGLVIRAGRGQEVFASVSRSFETPTTTELANRPEGAGGFNLDLEPQTGFNVEGGLRGRLAGARYEVTLFQTELEGELVPFEVPSAPGRTFFRNAGRSRHRGWEVALDARLAPPVSLRLAYTRINARFEEFVTDDADYSGNRVPGLAPHRVDGILRFQDGPLFAEVRGLYQDDVPVNDAGTAASDAFFVTDVRLGLDGFRSGGVEVSPFLAVQNVFDVRYNSSVVVNAFGGRYFEPGPGRALTVGGSVAFAR